MKFLSFEEQVQSCIKSLQSLEQKPIKLSIWDKFTITFWIWIAR